MKKRLILFALPLLLCSCKANFPVAQQSGKEDIAYLLDEKTKKSLEESKPSFGNLNIKEVMQSDFCFA